MAHPDRRSVVATVGFVASLAGLTACGGSPAPQPTSTSSAATIASARSPEPTTSTAPQPLDREVSAYTGFISPTGNVSCAIDVDLARCDIIDHDWEPPPRPTDCEFDYGQGIQIVPGEPASFVCAGDTTFGPEDILAYGQAITAGPLRCESQKSGITCRDVESDHSFTISLEAYHLS